MTDDVHDAFACDNLWKSSPFLEDPATFETSLFAPIELDLPSIKFDNPYAPIEPLEKALRLPDIEAFQFGPLPELDSFDESSISLETPPTEVEEEDVWQVALELGPANKDVAFFTWEAFDNTEHVEEKTTYISESGPRLFDAALVKDDDSVPAGRVLKGDVLLESLWNLGLGRSSILFSFDRKLASFEPAIADGRVTGLSLRISKSLINQFITTGNTFLYLRSFVERTFASSLSIPARVALATSVSSIISTFENHLGRHSSKITSLLQLQRLFEKPWQILNYIARTVDAVKRAQSNEELSSILHHRALEIEEGDEYVRQMSYEILRRVSKPSLDLFGEWIGIQQEQQTVPITERGSFVAIDDSSEHGPAEYIYRPDMMPRYISPEDGNTIFETGNSLRFLKLHHPDHPMASMSKFGVNAPGLQWEFGWQEIESISQKAKVYEEQLRAAILHLSKGRVSGPPTASLTEDTSQEMIGDSFQQYLDSSTREFDAPPQQFLGALPDELQLITSHILQKSTTADPSTSAEFSPPLSITPTLSFRPLLIAQAKLVNATTLRLFFRSHNLSLHLNLQRQYQLLGDGVFSSRLASALFDPDRESAQRHKGKMRSGVHMGLQLGSRENWPPASSELRLALMGVLSESYHSSALYHSTRKTPSDKKTVQRTKNEELPGQLNFAIRHLTNAEIATILNPHALPALDFLYLQYIPPSPLHLVLTSPILEKYDTVWKFLLRLLRVLFVVSRLPRTYANDEGGQSRSFRMEAHHFVTCLSTYAFQTGIASHWDVFNKYVNTLEARLIAEDEAGELGTRVTEGLAELREAHERCLDSILFSLLLRKRQKKVMSLVEEIFELILLFAKKQNAESMKSGKDSVGVGNKGESVKELYADLRGKFRVFLSVCRGLTGKKGYGKGRGTGEENLLERLEVLLGMSGYWDVA